MNGPRKPDEGVALPRTMPADEAGDATATFARVTVVSPRRQPAAPTLRAVPRGLTATLLPGERVTLGTSPHPIVLVRPFAGLIAVALAFAWAWRVVPIGDRLALDAAGALTALGCIATLIRNAGYYFGFRAVATNRRVFVIRGILRRRFAPLGNTALASSTLMQGVFGRLYGFGSVDVPQTATRRPLFRDVRNAGELFRECQAVANGVDGDVWTPAVRQTIVP